MIYPADFEAKIGFDSIRQYLYDHSQSRMAKDEVSAMSFLTDFEAIKNKLECVSEMVAIIRTGDNLPLGNIHDVIPYLKEIKANGSFMSADRLYKLMSMLSMAVELRKFFTHRDEDEETAKYPRLSELTSTLGEFPALVSVIERAVNKFGELKDTASPALYEIRQEIKSATGSMQRAMRRVLDNAIAEGIVDKDTTPALRDGRMVIPVNAGSKRELRGIVHDESATGKTVFIEPVEVVEAGNKLRKLQLDEQHEIVLILMSIAAEIRPHINDISETCLLIGKLEFIKAKALFAIDVDAHLPSIHNKEELEWYHAVHPGLLMSLRQQGRSVVPLNITLTHKQRILIISGPNAGGKSVCLKTVSAVQYMMQCGLLPTLYDNSHMGIFNNIFIDIGDQQSFENDLSTYSSHLKNMKYFLTHANKRTLLMADEMGSGTEPQIGGAMAQAILKELGHSNCMGIITTHYQNLKSFAESEEGFVNGAMLYDRQKLQPTFELSIGNPGSSFALDIAGKIGLPQQVIESAKEIAGSDYVNLDKYLSEIARDRRYWANKRQNIREKEVKLDSLLEKYEETAGDLRSQRNAILRDARNQAEEIIRESNARIERTILEIRKAEAEKQKTKELRSELSQYKAELSERLSSETDKQPEAIKQLAHKSKKSRQPKPAPKPVETKRELVVGDYVKMKDSSTVGSILAISGKKAEVAFGALRTSVALDKLEHAKKPKATALSATGSISSATTDSSRSRQLNFKNEIDVRGMRADEALQAVTYFIDDAIQFSAQRVRILHGTGHGILKTLIRQLLNTVPGVKHFADEDVRFGGAGITVVDLD